MGASKLMATAGSAVGLGQKTAAAERRYSAHRERQRLRIVAAAEGLFAAGGMDEVSMLEITAAAGVQPSTLYQYFKSKEEIVWAIAAEIVRGMRERVVARMEGRGLALDKVRMVLELMAEELEERPEDVRFMAQFDVLYARDFSADAVRALTGDGGEPFADFKRLVKEGIKDGSMRGDLDPKLSLHALMNAAIGTQRRLGSLGVKVEEEYGKRTGELFRESVRLLLEGLRGEGPPVQGAAPPAPGKAEVVKKKGKKGRRS